ncbi:tyrosine-type recombinase/integrase [Halolamina salifodinae]|uniref:Integrase n=1 Tax=Halolamina salifodinae TaxID=1202767 RepID=A0A8T4GXE4_9EURY|nr:site-specific integrase [Halolamina salifodinae]MBP1987629.1 integrase [Halolamina salifodinae]
MEDNPLNESGLIGSRSVEVEFPLVPEENRSMLAHKQEFDYENTRKEFAEWLLLEGKDPRDVVGYTQGTAKRTVYRVAFCERWVWGEEDEYVPTLTTSHADDFIEAMAYSDYSNSHKHSCLHSLKRYFNWRHHEFGGDEWEPDRSFSTGNGQQPQDYLSTTERAELRHTALEHGDIPAYKTVKCKEKRRERLKPYVAERVNKPIEALGVDDWGDIGSWKLTSLVWVSLDAGLRPTEVERAKTSWVDVENSLLRIPKEESAKNVENWNVSLRDRTADALEKWIHERTHYPKYDDNDSLWLTTHGNPYGSKSLRRLLLKLCEKAGVPHESRKMSWYSIRHSVGTYMTRAEDLAATQEQLRHKRPETTMKYDGTPPEDRRDALDKMG